MELAHAFFTFAVPLTPPFKPQTQAQQQFQAAIAQPDEQIDLARASLCIAQGQYLDLDPAYYLNTLDSIALEIQSRLPEERYPLRVLKIINAYLFDELGFQGNSDSYYDPRNSFLNEVIDRCTGIPITLSVVYLEIAKRLNFPMVGVGMPGHFIIRPHIEDMAVYVDPFHGGEIMFEQDCQKRLESIYQRSITFRTDMLPDVSNHQILRRMLTNLKIIYLKEEAFGNALNTIEWLLLLCPDEPMELRDRGLVLYELERWEASLQSLEEYLALWPMAEDGRVIRELLEYMRRQL